MNEQYCQALLNAKYCPRVAAVASVGSNKVAPSSEQRFLNPGQLVQAVSCTRLDLDLDLDSSHIQLDTLGRTPTPSVSVNSCHLCFLPAESRPLSRSWLTVLLQFALGRPGPLLYPGRCQYTRLAVLYAGGPYGRAPQKHTNKPCDLDLDNQQRLSRYIFTKNFIKVRTAVHEFSQSFNNDENNTAWLLLGAFLDNDVFSQSNTASKAQRTDVQS